MTSATGDIWVFAYGSLMWDPRVPVAEAVPATLTGFHRVFCLESTEARGTPAKPGLVLGLMAGGQCQGLALRIAAHDADAALAALDRREMSQDHYTRQRLRLRRHGALLLPGGQAVDAYVYVANPASRRHVGALDPDRAAARIAGTGGTRGPNWGYLQGTVAALARHGLADPAMDDLWARVRRRLGPAAPRRRLAGPGAAR